MKNKILTCSPKISIVTPSYNQGQFLEKTILSIINQNYPNLEYIIMDGGSTDNSVEIIKKYQAHLTYWQSAPDNGPASAINNGFKKATGEIFAYLNSDDKYYPGTLAAIAQYFAANPEIGLVYGDIMFIDSNGKTKRHLGSKRFRPTQLSLKMMAAGYNTIPQQATFWHQEIYRQVGGFNEENTTSWDGEFFTDAAILGHQFKYIPKLLAKFRIHTASITGSGRLQAQYQKDYQRYMQKFAQAGINLSFWQKKNYGIIYRLKRILGVLGCHL